MVIEHTFVTTLEQENAFRVAAAFLAARGFVSDDKTAPSNSLQMRRGQANPAKARSISELPQSLRLDFDRGRIALAAAVTPSPSWGGRSWASSEVETRTADTNDPKRLKLHTDLLMAIVAGLELLLVHHASPEVAYARWDETELLISDAARRRKRHVTIAVIALGLLIAGIIAMIVCMV